MACGDRWSFQQPNLVDMIRDAESADVLVFQWVSSFGDASRRYAAAGSRRALALTVTNYPSKEVQKNGS